ncbi:phage tail protein [Cupriavidus basilensis]|uniref:phage tail protein n=1 Tax=Cupriavidus basilensis TaxID=68895 RepID=UPI0039F70BEE
MTDIYHLWGEDLNVSPSGDLLVANESDTTTQQILRALLTNAAFSDASGNPIASADYSDHPTYGASLPRRIGSTMDVGAIRAVVRSVVFGFPQVARSPAPAIDVSPFADGVSINISYLNLVTGETDTLSFDLGK